MMRRPDENGETVPGSESTQTATNFDADNPARVLPLVSGTGDRRLLTEWISNQPEYEVVDPHPESTTLTTADFDLGIIDQASLQTYLKELRSRKAAESPVLLPYLLLYPEEDPSVIEIDRGELADTVLKEAVDEIVTLPMKKAELAWRVDALLRLRSQSLELESEKRSMERFKRAADAAGHAVYITDSDATIQYVNPAFERITGYSVEEAVGENPRILNSGEMSEEYFEELWNTVTEGEMWQEEVINRRKSGEVYYAEQTIAPIVGDDDTVESYVAIQQDITERKRGRRNLELYRQSVESSIDLLAAVDGDYEYLFANETYCEYHGVDRSTIEGQTLPEVLGKEAFAEVEDAMNAALAGEQRELEVRRETAGKGERTLQTYFFPILDDDDEVMGVGASMRDVTEQREQERHLETLIGNLPGIVYRCADEPGWPMELIRGRSEELTGYSAAEIADGPVSWGEDVIHTDDQKTVWNEVRSAVDAGEPFELTYRIRTQSGDEKWVWERGRQVSPVDSEQSKLEGFISDITNRKRLEEDLRETKERYESLFGSIRDAILVADMDRRIINCNPAFTELFGYELSEIEGKPTRFVYESEEEFEKLGEAIDGHFDDPEFTTTVTYEKKSGQTFPGETNVFYLRDTDDEIVGYIGLIRDVSDRRDRLTQLQAIDRVLQHNFHNDMNVIIGFADYIESDGESPYSKPAARIKDTGEKLLRTIQKEREITEFLSDPPPITTVDVNELCEHVRDTVESDYPNASVSIGNGEGHEASATIAIERAVEELVRNSIVHSESAEPAVTVDIASDEECVMIEVKDENPRIPEMERKVLTGREELSPLYHGSGMGLWLVTQIVSHSDGVLEFAENEPRGNIVKIRLPTPDGTTQGT